MRFPKNVIDPTLGTAFPHWDASVQPRSEVRDVVHSDIDEAFGISEFLVGDWLQLSPGKLDFRTLELSFPNLFVRFSHTTQLTHGIEAWKKNDLFVTAILDSNQPVKRESREFGTWITEEYQSGRETDFVIGPGTIVLEVFVPEEAANEAGWKTGKAKAVPLPSRLRQPLRSMARNWLGQGYEERGWENVDGPMPTCELVPGLIERLLDYRAHALARADTCLSSETTARFLVNRAMEIVARAEEPNEHTTSGLCRRLGVSDRTLQNAFRSQIGVTPYRYFLIRRLHEVRRQLIRSPGKAGAVTGAAFEAGFTELGRMGQMYRRQFGETPSETLVTSRNQSSDAINET